MKLVEYNKLVRDNIPQIIVKNGGKAYYKILGEQEFLEALLKKDVEELEEVKNAKNEDEIKEELADKLEVLIAIASIYNFDLKDIIKEADKKRKIKGGFKQRIFLNQTIVED